tara:strand:+ start:698 stop:1063 length:366 start_codon:yes stop_codon:yes gene_type:complete
MKDLVKTSAQVVASLGTTEKAIEVTYSKMNFLLNKLALMSIGNYCQEPIEGVDANEFKRVSEAVDKFTKIYTYLSSLSYDLWHTNSTDKIAMECIKHNFHYLRFIDEKCFWLDRAVPKWAQ